MKKVVLLFHLLLSAVFCISSSVSATNRGISVVSKQGQNLYLYKDYQALVIGVSNYERWPKLPNAAKDAMEVADRLNKMGVHVKLVLDPTYRELRSALTDMIYTMGREKNRGILFYYAGHGETETLAAGSKMGYIIPRDCPLLRVNPKGFANHAISMKEIESASMRIRSKHVLMLFDSCFSGALFALVRAVPHDITEKSTLPVRQYITAGREDEEVPDKSMFKRCLLIGLEGDADLTGDGFITGSELGMYLSDKVVNYTHRQQHPQYGKINNPDLDRGDFIFSLGRSLSSSDTTPSISTTSESQRLAEERVRLERERRELERLKAEIAGRRQQVQEKKTDVANVPQKSKPGIAPIAAPEIKRDGVYVAYANGIVRDTKTGLEWVAGPDEETTFEEAKSWVQSLTIDGGGWRMPTEAELNTLYKTGAGLRNMTPLLKTSGWVVWCIETEGSSDAWDFTFYNGSRNWLYRSISSYKRAFAVRSRSDG